MFANDKSIETLGQLFEECKKYILLQKEYMRLELVEKLTVLSSTCIMVVIAIILGMMALFYLSFSVAYILAPHVGGLTVSFAIITAFLLLLLAVVLFLRRMTEATKISVFHDEVDVAHGTESNAHEVLKVAKGVEIYEIEGPFFFGIATKFDELMRSMADRPLVRIIRMRRVPFIDSTAIHNLEILITSSQKEKIHVILSGVNPRVHETLKKANIDKLIGDDHICDHITKAVAKANEFVAEMKK